MRLRLRAAAFFALSLVTIQCTDGPTSPKTTPSPATSISAGRLSLAPSFSTEAGRAFGALAALGVDVTEVHVHLTATNGSTQDTTVPFPTTQDTLVLEIPVSVEGTDQPFTALIELRNDQHVVLFSGTQVVIARAGKTPVGAPAVILLQYTGPGRGTRTVTLGPPDTTVASSAVLPFAATAVDSSGKAVTDLLVQWTSSDATLATVTPTGNAAATVSGLGRRGAVTISATTPQGVTGAAKVTLVPPAARVVVISGGGQTGVAGSALAQPLVVEVQAADNLPVPGAPVVFRAVTTGGVVKTVTTVADAQGRASTTLTLGPIAGPYQFEASSGSLTPVSASVTATPAPAAALAIVSGDAQVDSLGRALAQPLVVKVTDQFGGAVNAATVTWTQSAGTGTLGATTSLTSSNGTASTTYTLGNVVGFDTVRASVAGVSGSVAFSLRTIGRGPAQIAILSGGGQTGALGATLPLPVVARVTDALNNPVPNASVVWGAAANTATFNPATSVTGANGQTFTMVTLGSVAGAVTLTASAGGTIVAATFATATGTAPVATKLLMATQPPTSTPAGSTLTPAPSVQLADASGNAVALSGVVVTAIQTGTGVLSGVVTATTNASGLATFSSLILSGAIGPTTIQFSDGVHSTAISRVINVLAGAGTQLSLTTSPSLTATSGAPLATQPVIQLRDASGNPVNQSGVVITAVLSSGTLTLANPTATTNGNGTATFSSLTISGTAGNFVIQFGATNYASVQSGTIVLSAGSPTQLAITTQPSDTAQIDINLPRQPVVRLRDASGNNVSLANVSVTATLVGPGTIGGATALTDTSGQAVFTSLVFLSGSAGSYNLRFSSGSLPLVTSAPITLLSGGSSLMVKAGTEFSADPVGTQAPSISPVFVARNAAGAPLVGQPVTLDMFGRCLFIKLTFLSSIVDTTDAQGEVHPTVRLQSGPEGTGCVIRASAGFTTQTDSSMLGVYPTLTTHVWNGGRVSNDWSTAGNWKAVGSGVGAPTLTTDRPFVPFYPTVLLNPPTLSASRLSVAAIVLDSSVTVDLNDLSIDVGAGGVPGMNGRFINGVVHLQATGTMNGVFDQLDIGQAGSCGSLAPMTANLGFLRAANLNIYCKTQIDTSSVATLNMNVLPNAGNSWLTINGRGALAVSNNANFAGDSLYVIGGFLSVNGSATLGGGHVMFTSGSKLNVQGPAFFNATVGGDYTGVKVLLGSDATFGGAGAGQQSFAGDTLVILGNLTQLTGAVPTTFRTSSDHVTMFAGSIAQNISFADPTQSMFSVLRVANAVDVRLLTNVQMVNGTTQPRVQILSGKLTVNSGMTFSVNGNLALGSLTNLDILGAVTQTAGTCTGRASPILGTITGTGTYNGTLVSALSPAFCQ